MEKGTLGQLCKAMEGSRKFNMAHCTLSGKNHWPWENKGLLLVSPEPWNKGEGLRVKLRPPAKDITSINEIRDDFRAFDIHKHVSLKQYWLPAVEMETMCTADKDIL